MIRRADITPLTGGFAAAALADARLPEPGWIAAIAWLAFVAHTIKPVDTRHSMETMKIPKNSSLAALIVFFGGIYPILSLGEAVDWPRPVQTALACIGLALFTGVKVAVMVRNRKQTRLTYPRRADARPRRTWRERRLAERR